MSCDKVYEMVVRMYVLLLLEVVMLCVPLRACDCDQVAARCAQVVI